MIFYSARLVILGLVGAAASIHAADELPITGIAHVGFRITDLESSRAYYSGVLGLAEAFDLKDSSGKVTAAYFKVNDDQFVELIPGLPENENNRLAHVAFVTTDLEGLRRTYDGRGMNPSAIGNFPDGTRGFSVKDPEGAELRFVEYTPKSQQALARGKFLDLRRFSTHIYHVGIFSADRAVMTAFYKDKLGFDAGRNVPGGRGEFLELTGAGRDVETKDPPIDPAVAATHDQYVREQWGSVQHVCLEVADIQVAKRITQERGHYSDGRVAPHIGNNRHWLMNIFDPDGSRTEIMEPTLQPAPK